MRAAKRSTGAGERTRRNGKARAGAWGMRSGAGSGSGSGSFVQVTTATRIPGDTTREHAPVNGRSPHPSILDLPYA